MAGLLNISEMGALALHVLVDLAILREEDPEARRTAREIANSLHASVHTLQKVARRLIVLEWIEGARGVNGGLKLAVDPQTITLLQALEGVEGRICSNGCMFAKRVCLPPVQCVFEGLMGKMETKVREYLTRTTLADLRVEPA